MLIAKGLIFSNSTEGNNNTLEKWKKRCLIRGQKEIIFSNSTKTNDILELCKKKSNLEILQREYPAAEQVIWELEREGRVAPGGGYGNTDNVMKCLT